MDAQLALELATALPELRMPCPGVAHEPGEGFQGGWLVCAHGQAFRIVASRAVALQADDTSAGDCPTCHGTGWVPAALHVETIVEAMLTAGYEHESHAVPDWENCTGMTDPYSHAFAWSDSKWKLRHDEPQFTFIFGGDNLETCVKAALAALKREAKP